MPEQNFEEPKTIYMYIKKTVSWLTLYVEHHESCIGDEEYKDMHR